MTFWQTQTRETRTGRLNCMSCSQLSSAACQCNIILEFLFQFERAAFRPASHHCKCRLFACACTSSVTAGTDKHLSTFSAGSQGPALLMSCFPADLYPWDTLLKEHPASHSFMWLAAKHQLIFAFLTPVTETEHQQSTTGACCVVVAPYLCTQRCDNTEAQGTHPCSAALKLVVMPPRAWSITAQAAGKHRRNSLCGREAEGARVDLL